MAWERLKPHEILTRIPRDTEVEAAEGCSFLKLYISHTQPYFFPEKKAASMAYLQMGASKAV